MWLGVKIYIKGFDSSFKIRHWPPIYVYGQSPTWEIKVNCLHCFNLIKEKEIKASFLVHPQEVIFLYLHITGKCPSLQFCFWVLIFALLCLVYWVSERKRISIEMYVAILIFFFFGTLLLEASLVIKGGAIRFWVMNV